MTIDAKTRICLTTAMLPHCTPPGSDRRRSSRNLNFVLILMDDLGWADLSCYGSKFYETPNLDRMAAQGIRFTNGYAACPVCSPTRAAVMTGKFAARSGITNYLPGKHQLPYSKLLPPESKPFLGPEGSDHRRGSEGGWVYHSTHRQMAPGADGGVLAREAGIRRQHRRHEQWNAEELLLPAMERQPADRGP